MVAEGFLEVGLVAGAAEHFRIDIDPRLIRSSQPKSRVSPRFSTSVGTEIQSSRLHDRH